MNVRQIPLFLALLFSVVFSLSACDWCLDEENIVQVTIDALHEEPLPKAVTQEGTEFYDECILIHYPRAYVIRDVYFMQMCPKALDRALREVVNILARETWFYFSDDRALFRWGAHWDRVLRVCVILDDFIATACVESAHEPVVQREDYVMHLNRQRMGVPLRSYWRNNGYTAHYDFYALYFDYTIKFFNEGIKFRRPKKARRYYYDLQEIRSHLMGSRYQTTYEQAFERAKRLYQMLREGGTDG